jgi:hypothetical protein
VIINFNFKVDKWNDESLNLNPLHNAMFISTEISSQDKYILRSYSFNVNLLTYIYIY